MSFKEAERRKESKYICIAFVTSAFLFIILGSLHLFLWIQVKYLMSVLNPVWLYSHQPPCAVIGKYIKFLCVIGPSIQLNIHCFTLFKWLREEMIRNRHLYSFIITSLPLSVLFVLCVCVCVCVCVCALCVFR